MRLLPQFKPTHWHTTALFVVWKNTKSKGNIIHVSFLAKKTKSLLCEVKITGCTSYVSLICWVTHHKTLTCYMSSVLFETLRYVSNFFFKYLQLHCLPCCVQPVLLYGCAVWEVVNTVIPNPDEGRRAGCSQPWNLRGILRDQSWATVTWPAALTPNTCGKEQNSLSAHSG